MIPDFVFVDTMKLLNPPEVELSEYLHIRCDNAQIFGDISTRLNVLFKSFRTHRE